MKNGLFRSVVLWSCCSSLGFAGQGAVRPRTFGRPDTLALTGATVVDGVGTRGRQATVVIESGRIAYVGDAAGVRLGPRVRILDLTGRSIIPGLVDTHAHLPGDAEVEPQLRQMLAFGVTALRDPASPLVRLRARLETGALVGPRIRVAGVLIDGKDSIWSFAARTTSEQETRDIVRQQLAQKVDFIKLYVGLPPSFVRAAIEEAHRHGVPVMGHLGATTWEEAAELGIDSLAHSWYAGLAHSVVPAERRAEFRDFYVPNGRFRAALFGPWRGAVEPRGPDVVRLARLLRDRRAEVHPNLVLGEAVTWGDDPAVLERLEPWRASPLVAARWRLGPHPYSSGWSADERAEAKLAFPLMVQIVRTFHEAGVLLTAGTDNGNPWMTPGVALHRELELLVEAGIPPVEVLRIATRNGAQALGMLRETGTIEAGKRADLVVLSADPLASISNTRKIERVLLNGVPHEPQALLAAP